MENGALNKMSKLSVNDVFKQKGGTLGLLIIAVIVVLIAFNLPAILAWVNNLVRLVGSLLVLGLILFVVFDKRTRLAASTWYMLMVRKLMGLIVRMDPIAILEDTIKRAYKTIAKLEKAMGNLNGVYKGFEKKVEVKKVELTDCLERKKVAIKTGKKEVELLEDRQSVRIEALIKDYISLRDSAEKWYDTLSKLAEMAKFTVTDAENEVEAQKEKYEMVKQSHSAFKSAMSVINGDPDELALYNQAFQFVEKDIMEKLGEMDRVINSAGGIVDKIDIDNEVFKVKGDDLLKKYEELGIDALFAKMETPPNKQFPTESIVSGSDPVLTESKKKYFK
jgi:hypothetical protein